MKRLAGWKWITVGVSLYFIIYALLNSSHQDYFYQNQVAVLAYHHLSSTVSGDVTITPQLFQKQLKDLKNRGFQFISFETFKSFMKGGIIPPNAVLVTFDDGYESFYTDAYPILRKLHIPAVNFVITKDLEHPQDSNIPSLSRDEILRMTKETRDINVECHSDNLHDLTPSGSPLLTTKINNHDDRQETDKQFSQRIMNDTQTCISKLSDLTAGPIDSYAYPFGSYSDDAVTLIHQAGISYAFTTVSELVTSDTDRMHIPRINAGSPFIKFNSLNNLIMRRIVDPLSLTYAVPLQQALIQIGGGFVESNGRIQIALENETWTISKDRQEAERDQHPSIPLHKKIMSKDQKFYMELQDLEAILGFQIVYNANTDQYSRRYTPTSSL